MYEDCSMDAPPARGPAAGPGEPRQLPQAASRAAQLVARDFLELLHAIYLLPPSNLN